MRAGFVGYVIGWEAEVLCKNLIFHWILLASNADEESFFSDIPFLQTLRLWKSFSSESAAWFATVFIKSSPEKSLPWYFLINFTEICMWIKKNDEKIHFPLHIQQKKVQKEVV